MTYADVYIGRLGEGPDPLDWGGDWNGNAPGRANLSKQQILDFFNAVCEPDPGRSLFAGAKPLVDEMRDLISNAARRALRAGGKRTLSYRCRTEPSTRSRTAVSN